MAIDLTGVSHISKKWGDGFRRPRWPRATCYITPDDSFDISYAELRGLLKDGRVISATQEWIDRRGGGERYVSFFLPAPPPGRPTAILVDSDGVRDLVAARNR